MNGTLTARQVTAALRVLFPHVRPLATRTSLRDKGFTVIMPEPAARHWGVTFDADAAGAYLSRALGTEVRVTAVRRSRRRDGGRLVRVTLAKAVTPP